MADPRQSRGTQEPSREFILISEGDAVIPATALPGLDPPRLGRARKPRVSPVGWTLIASLLLWPPSVGASPRTWQPLVLKGSQVAPLLGRPTDTIEVLASHDGHLVPIPFQIDEVLPDGGFALPAGPERVSDDSPGVLDNDDELVMMISDLGPRTGAAAESGTVEIVVSDPLGGEKRYAYLESATRPRRSRTDYVEYNHRRRRIESDHYRLGFEDEKPVDFALQTHKHSAAMNMIDAFRVEVRARILTFFKYHLSEKDISSRLLAWRDGPIRVVRRISHSANLLFGISSPEVTTHDFFYRDFIENPVRIKFPWVPSAVFGDIRVKVFIEWRKLGEYRISWSGTSGSPRTISDGRWNPALDGEVPGPLVDWVALEGGGRVMVQTIEPSPDLELIERRLYVRDFEAETMQAALTGPPTEPRRRIGIGYLMTGWERLSSGTHYMNSLMVSAPNNYSPAVLLEELSTRPIVRLHVKPAPE